MTMFWDVTSCSQVEIDRYDYGSSKNLWNVGQFLSDYTA
jgi:hypothetical protein